MRLAKKILWVFFLLPLLLLNTKNALGTVSDDYAPDVATRVARISFLRGETQIKRADSRDWERASQNLPIVEGDELVTEPGSRLEIQFNKDNYLRLSENAYLKVISLRDEGIALSLPNGTLSLRVLSFDDTRTFFEIDAPQTTVAVQSAGMYRIDAGERNDTQVRVTVTDDGQARIYTDNSGFTLRSGRSATFQLAGSYAGEWDTTDAARYADDFDSWALQRDAVIAKRLRDAHYDQYYDRDIYGAEDLSEYGEWIYTKKYGYVWRPDRNATNDYTNWSPYRYGQWRWMPYYGWTWVNDEPWGWATYHHGRWFYDAGYWYWSPYSAHRGNRSWWRPALVVLNYAGNFLCWYPLPYDYGYYNYNYSTYIDRRRYNTTIINNIIVNPTPTPNVSSNIRPSPTPLGTPITVMEAQTGALEGATYPGARVPRSGVVGVPASEFGKGTRDFTTAPPELARKVLSEKPSASLDALKLPAYRDLSGKLSSRIRAERPKLEKVEATIKTGAAERQTGAPLDEKLRTERIYGNRPPIERTPPNAETRRGSKIESGSQIRDTGAIERQTRPAVIENNIERRKTPPRGDVTNDSDVRSIGGQSDDRKRERSPAQRPRRDDNEIRPSPPIYVPPAQKEKRQPPTRQPDPPRYDPPPTRQPDPPKRDDPPPVRQPDPPQREQKPEQKPAPPSEDRGKKPDKDN